jgi:glycosyltransferase involved in cell wall biosynthesis
MRNGNLQRAAPFEAPEIGGTAEVPLARVFLVSERFGHSAGGEAIKGQHYADALLAQGRDVIVFTHERALGLGAEFPADRLRIVKETALQGWLWKVSPLRPLVSVYFHLRARRLILDELARDAGDRAKPILHYISPVSPAALRFPPRGLYVVMGALTGNIYYPPAFRQRMSFGDRLREALHRVTQSTIGRFAGEKRRVGAVLNSGYDRTRLSLHMAGCPDDRILDVVDAGVADALFERSRITHEGYNPRFVCSGRLVDHKGVDLTIKALALTDPSLTLDIYGDGVMRASLEQLTDELRLRDRVRFHGWMERHEDLIAAFANYRGYLFPSLAEANGIVMQEAMTLGLPVIALRWGGPGMLADDDSALYIEPGNENQVVADIARAMDRLALDGALAERVSLSARAIADRRFRWRDVVASWQAGYKDTTGKGKQGAG